VKWQVDLVEYRSPAAVMKHEVAAGPQVDGERLRLRSVGNAGWGR